jgi:hypothetical protein
MPYTKLTITFPSDLASQVRRRVPRRHVSSFLASAARDKLLRDGPGQLDKILAEGYAVRADEARAISSEWDSTTGDGL